MSREQVRYLRDAAHRLRSVAAQYKTELSEKLIHLAEEFEAKALELETGKEAGRAAC